MWYEIYEGKKLVKEGDSTIKVGNAMCLEGIMCIRDVQIWDLAVLTWIDILAVQGLMV